MKTPEEKKHFACLNIIARELSDLILAYQNYSVTEHMASIRRKCNHPEGKDPYFWDDFEMQKAIEKHREWLDNDAALYKEPQVITTYIYGTNNY